MHIERTLKTMPQLKAIKNIPHKFIEFQKHICSASEIITQSVSITTPVHINKNSILTKALSQ